MCSRQAPKSRMAGLKDLGSFGQTRSELCSDKRASARQRANDAICPPDLDADLQSGYCQSSLVSLSMLVILTQMHGNAYLGCSYPVVQVAKFNNKLGARVTISDAVWLNGIDRTLQRNLHNATLREHRDGQDHQPISANFRLEAASHFPSLIGQRRACLRDPQAINSASWCTRSSQPFVTF